MLSPSLGRLALLAGATGPPLHVAVFLVDGFIHPAYNPVSDFVSELSRGDLGWLQVANFLVLGACLLVFASGIRWGARRGPGSAPGAALFAVIGAAYVVSGLFVTDAHGASVQTLTGTIHNFAGLLIAAGLIAACFIFARRFQGPMRTYSLASGIFVLLFFLLTFLAGFPLGIIGILQRITIIAALAWVTVLALTLRADVVQR